MGLSLKYAKKTLRTRWRIMAELANQELESPPGTASEGAIYDIEPASFDSLPKRPRSDFAAQAAPLVLPLVADLVARRARPQPRKTPPWLIFMGDEFLDDIGGIDKKLQGRILSAIGVLSGSDLQVKGDTIKPLSGQFSGCWRYRIGDFRMIFAPNKDTGTLAMLAFKPRGGAYD
jgi:mRNA-degrading endonuclease RelE of RelBE toxin-antitoxin system